MNRFIASIIILLITACTIRAQQKYWIYPKVKMSSHELKSHANKLNLQPVVISEWLSAYSVVLDDKEALELKEDITISNIHKLSKKLKIQSHSELSELNISKALEQLKADTLIKLGVNGTGVKIGIIDAGFLNADKDKSLENIVSSGRVLGYKNYIEQDATSPYAGNTSNNDSHGSKVFSFLAGTTLEKYNGLASGAEFYLARTDQADKEYHGEEDYWIAALEWMHSQGVRLVNSSLGYSDGFDDPSTDYKREHVDGEFSTITRAAEIAIKEKEMTIVLSAGNDGNGDFEIISIPADAEGVLSVGASGYRYWNKLGYSSIGPERLDAVKPEVSCYAAGGTSFAAPVITGLVACIKDLKPEINNDDILDILQRSSHLYPYPNNYLGYGVPNVNKVLQLIESSDYKFQNSLSQEAKDSVNISLPKSYNIMAFHKKNEYVVESQEKLKWSKGTVSISRPAGTLYTTVATPDFVWEIRWIKD